MGISWKEILRWQRKKMEIENIEFKNKERYNLI